MPNYTRHTRNKENYFSFRNIYFFIYFERLGGVVEVCVLLQRIGVREGSIALVTGKRPLTGVGPGVDLKLAFLLEHCHETMKFKKS